jgi:hypothetical protein
MTDETSTPAKHPPKKDLPVEVGTHFLQQRYLYAFATQAEVTHYIRTQAIPDESARLNEFLNKWADLQPRVQQLIQNESGLPDMITLSDLPRGYESQVGRYTGDELFKRTFSDLPIDIGMVEIDKLIAAQRTVNLEYVGRLKSSFPKSFGISELLEICVAPTRPMDPIQHLELGPNVHVFSSPNADIRFLGSFLKNITNEDLEAAVHGGIPAAAIISFVGYGGASVNVIRAGNRVVLNNGFHRVFALREAGVTHIPVVIQLSNNPALDFPPQVAGLPKEYLLGMPRPVLMKDFFEPDFAITLRVRKRIKVITLSAGVGQHDVPA